MQRGFVRLWRASLDSPAWENPKLWRLWCYCLLRATYTPRQVAPGGRPLDLAPGELAASLRAVARDTGLSFREVRTCLALAERLGLLTRRRAAGASVIAVRDWDRLQAAPAGREQDPPARAAADFERFFAAYPRKVGRSEAALVFERLRLLLPPVETLLAAVARQARSEQWQRDNGRFIPNPAAWLAKRRWEDELPAAQGSPGPRGDAVDPAELAREIEGARRRARPMPEAFARRLGLAVPGLAAAEG
jgi:hypothetical protein